MPAHLCVCELIHCHIACYSTTAQLYVAGDPLNPTRESGQQCTARNGTKWFSMYQHTKTVKVRGWLYKQGSEKHLKHATLTGKKKKNLGTISACVLSCVASASSFRSTRRWSADGQKPGLKGPDGHILRHTAQPQLPSLDAS